MFLISCVFLQSVISSLILYGLSFSDLYRNGQYRVVEYIFNEYTGVLIIYVDAGCNDRASQRMCHEHFQHPLTASHTIVVRIQLRLREITFQAMRADHYVPWIRSTLDSEEDGSPSSRRRDSIEEAYLMI